MTDRGIEWLIGEARKQKARSDILSAERGLGPECYQSIEATYAMRIVRRLEKAEGLEPNQPPQQGVG